VYEIVMPRLSDSMEEGTIVRWLKADGDEVARGEELVEIETDKATMTYESDFAGTLAIGAAEGETVAVGVPIAMLGAAVAAAAPAAVAQESPAVAVAAPVAEASPAVALAAGASSRRAGVNASPVARRVAKRLGVDLAALAGSGPHGRIVKADVAAAANGHAPAPAASAPAGPAPAAPPVTQELTRTQTTIARRMAESRATVPDFALEVDVDMTAALALRAELKAIADPAPSLNDIIIKACAIALGRHPKANGSYRDGRFALNAEVNVGFAVATEDSLIVPVVRDAAGKSLGTIGAESRALAGRVRAGSVTAADLSGGTFTVSNLGMFGIDRFEGIINAPQAAILCAGAVVERPVAVAGEVVVRPLMSLTLACDHRILYGADAARFLGDVRGALEQPLSLVL
jgi:pyruvate dehydrogenase E2 component (dihydrolipoamide acetyltransferase)